MGLSSVKFPNSNTPYVAIPGKSKDLTLMQVIARLMAAVAFCRLGCLWQLGCAAHSFIFLQKHNSSALEMR